jgi:hypothetical protein
MQVGFDGRGRTAEDRVVEVYVTRFSGGVPAVRSLLAVVPASSCVDQPSVRKRREPALTRILIPTGK